MSHSCLGRHTTDLEAPRWDDLLQRSNLGRLAWLASLTAEPGRPHRQYNSPPPHPEWWGLPEASEVRSLLRVLLCYGTKRTKRVFII